MKGLKITNIIIFSLICVLQIFITIFGVEMIIGAFSKQSGTMLGVALGLMPIYILMLIALAVLTIIITLTTIALNKNLKENNVQLNKFNQRRIS